MKFNICGLCMVFVLAISCSSDNDPVQDNPLTGSWTAIAYELQTSFDLNDDGTASNNLMEELDCYSFEVTFTQSNTFSATSTSIVLEVQEGDEYNAECEGVDQGNGTYSLAGEVLTTKADNNDELMFTVEIGGDTLQLTGANENIGMYTLILERK